MSAILPRSEIQKLLNVALAKNAKRKWELAGTLNVPDGKVEIFDPYYTDPFETEDSRKVYKLSVTTPVGLANLWLELLDYNAKRPRVSAVKIMLSDEEVINAENIGKVSTDGATLAVGSSVILAREWRIGGKGSESIVVIDYDEQNRETLQKLAIAALQQAGLRTSTSVIGDYFKGLSNDEIHFANQVLLRAGIKGRVVTTRPQSTQIIYEQLLQGHIAKLYSADSQPYLFAFVSGWGDGTYEWFGLNSNRGRVGFISRMIEED